MCKLYLIMRLISIGISISIKNIFIERKMSLFVKSHNRVVKKAIKAYNRNLKKMTTLNSIRVKVRDKILNSKKLQSFVTVHDMEKLEKSIEELNDIVKKNHDEFLGFLDKLFDESKNAINEYNMMVDKQKRVPYLFYRCNKVYMNEIIHSVKHSGR